MSDHSGPFLLVQLDRCLGCHTCEIACAVAHTRSGRLASAILAGEPLSSRTRVVQVLGKRFPMQCRQCEDAPCVKVCPTGATYRTETYTAVDPKRCIACKLCMMVCPFGAIHIGTVQVDGQSKTAAIKCDLCVNRAEGPACVAACPTHAIYPANLKDVRETSIQTSSERYLAAVTSQAELATGSLRTKGTLS
jgi:anaerobic carbon-monoxide dehydrogenase iron sulfur subunit